jgi:hypothetical protein
VTDWRQPLRKLVESELAEALPELPTKARREVAKRVVKLVIIVLMRDGYTVSMAGKALGFAKSTMSAWQHSDLEWAAAIAGARDEQRRWLIGKLKAIMDANADEEKDSQHLKGVGQAINVLSNLWFPELRESKVEATLNAAPKPGEARAKILSIVNKDG